VEKEEGKANATGSTPQKPGKRQPYVTPHDCDGVDKRIKKCQRRVLSAHAYQGVPGKGNPRQIIQPQHQRRHADSPTAGGNRTPRKCIELDRRDPLRNGQTPGWLGTHSEALIHTGFNTAPEVGGQGRKKTIGPSKEVSSLGIPFWGEKEQTGGPREGNGIQWRCLKKREILTEGWKKRGTGGERGPGWVLERLKKRDFCRGFWKRASGQVNGGEWCRRENLHWGRGKTRESGCVCLGLS